MFRSFAEIEEYILKNNLAKRLVLAGAHDDDALSAVVTARRKGCITATLVGREKEILELLHGMGEKAEDYTIISCDDERECARTAFTMVKVGEADIPMKGLMQTATFMRAVLDKQLGFVPEKGLLSSSIVLEYRDENRLMIISDCAVNITPGYEEKVKIVNNAVKLAHKLGNTMPKVAVIAPVETVNPAMPATIEAAMLSKAAQRGQIKGCIIDGPLALDNAVSAEAAKHKGIVSEVAGYADILIMPDLCTGNAFAKSLTYFAKLATSGTLGGTKIPVIMTSRSDSPENKYNSIITSILQTL